MSVPAAIVLGFLVAPPSAVVLLVFFAWADLALARRNLRTPSQGNPALGRRAMEWNPTSLARRSQEDKP